MRVPWLDSSFLPGNGSLSIIFHASWFLSGMLVAFGWDRRSFHPSSLLMNFRIFLILFTGDQKERLQQTVYKRSMPLRSKVSFLISWTWTQPYNLLWTIQRSGSDTWADRETKLQCSNTDLLLDRQLTVGQASLLHKWRPPGGNYLISGCARSASPHLTSTWL